MMHMDKLEQMLFPLSGGSLAPKNKDLCPVHIMQRDSEAGLWEKSVSISKPDQLPEFTSCSVGNVKFTSVVCFLISETNTVLYEVAFALKDRNPLSL